LISVLKGYEKYFLTPFEEFVTSFGR
jgi:hypothetical protein